MHTAFSDYLSPVQFIPEGQTHEDKMKDAADLANDFIRYFDEHKIFLDISLCNEIEDLIQTFRRTWSGSGAIKEEFKGTKWSDVWREFHDKVPPLRKEIEAQFRGMLGIKDKENSDEEEV